MPSPYLVLTSVTNSAVTQTNNPASVATSFLFTDPYPGDTINVSLKSTSGVTTWMLSILGTDGTVLVSAITVNQASTPAGVATIVLPSGVDDFSFILQSQVNSGTNLQLVSPQNPNGVDSTLTSTTKIAAKMSNRNSVSFAETQETNIANGYNALIVTRDVGPVLNPAVDGGLISRAVFAPFSGNPLAFSTAITLIDAVDQTKAFGYTTIASSTYQTPVPILRNTRNNSRAATSTTAMTYRNNNAAGVIPKTSNYTTSLPLSVFCVFSFDTDPGVTHWVWYKSGSSEASPSTGLGIGLSVTAAGLALVCNNTIYKLGVPFDYGVTHSVLLSLAGTTATIYFDKYPPITITGLTVNTLNQAFYLGDNIAANDTAFGMEFYDFRVYSQAKTQAQAWALAAGVY